MSNTTRSHDAVDTALVAAERKGFRLGMIGRTCALVPIALFYFISSPGRTT